MNRSKNTAIGRTKASRPLRDLIGQNASKVSGRVLDYGCGRGIDADYLDTNFECDVARFDKYHYPERPGGLFNLVLNTYVLNVVQGARERSGIITDIYRYLDRGGIAVITTRTDKEIAKLAKGRWTRTGDGWVTSSGTFQKGFSPEELEQFIVDSLSYAGISNREYMVTNIPRDTAKYTQRVIVRLGI